MRAPLTYINLSMKSSLKELGGDIRILQPYDLLARRPDVAARLQFDRISLKAPAAATAKVYVRYRPVGSPDTWALQRGALELGYLLVVDMDDFPFHEGYRESDFVAFRGAHAVQTSTPALAEHLRRLNPEVRVFANQIRDIPPFRPPPDRPPRLFFGALNRRESWQAVLPALNRVLADHPEVGIDVVWDRELFERLQTANKRLHPVLPYAGYLELLGAADVCLLPLGGAAIDLYKSDLKFLEAASRSTVSLASPVVYGATVRDGVTGVLYRTPAALETRLRRLLSDRAHRAAIAEAAHRYVAGARRMAAHVDGRLDWYRELLARKDELDRGVRERAGWLLEPGGRPPGRMPVQPSPGAARAASSDAT